MRKVLFRGMTKKTYWDDPRNQNRVVNGERDAAEEEVVMPLEPVLEPEVAMAVEERPTDNDGSNSTGAESSTTKKTVPCRVLAWDLIEEEGILYRGYPGKDKIEWRQESGLPTTEVESVKTKSKPTETDGFGDEIEQHQKQRWFDHPCYNNLNLTGKESTKEIDDKFAEILQEQLRYINTTHMVVGKDEHDEIMYDYEILTHNYIKIKEHPTMLKASDTSSEEENMRSWDFHRVVGVTKDADMQDINENGEEEMKRFTELPLDYWRDKVHRIQRFDNYRRAFEK